MCCQRPDSLETYSLDMWSLNITKNGKSAPPNLIVYPLPSLPKSSMSAAAVCGNLSKMWSVGEAVD